jgi:aminopeptidase N
VDPAFQKLLTEIPKRFAAKPLSTEDFRALAVSLMPPRSRDPKLETFFENWVYSTGVPRVRLTQSVSGLRLNGKLTQSGVSKDFEVDVPVEVVYAKGAPSVYWLRTSSDPVEFSIALKQAPVRVGIGAAFLQAK